MNKTFRYRYKRYVYDWTDYFEDEIEAKNINEAFIKIFADYNGVSFKMAEKIIEENLERKDWFVKDAIKWFNPLGSPSLALYRIDNIEEI